MENGKAEGPLALLGCLLVVVRVCIAIAILSHMPEDQRLLAWFVIVMTL